MQDNQEQINDQFQKLNESAAANSQSIITQQNIGNGNKSVLHNPKNKESLNDTLDRIASCIYKNQTLLQEYTQQNISNGNELQLHNEINKNESLPIKDIHLQQINKHIGFAASLNNSLIRYIKRQTALNAVQNAISGQNLKKLLQDKKLLEAKLKDKNQELENLAKEKNPLQQDNQEQINDQFQKLNESATANGQSIITQQNINNVNKSAFHNPKNKESLNDILNRIASDIYKNQTLLQEYTQQGLIPNQIKICSPSIIGTQQNISNENEPRLHNEINKNESLPIKDINLQQINKHIDFVASLNNSLIWYIKRQTAQNTVLNAVQNVISAQNLKKLLQDKKLLEAKLKDKNQELENLAKEKNPLQQENNQKSDIQLQIERVQHAKNFINSYQECIQGIQNINNFSSQCNNILEDIKDYIKGYTRPWNGKVYDIWNDAEFNWEQKYYSVKDKYKEPFKVDFTEHENLFTIIPLLKKIPFDGPQAFDSLVQKLNLNLGILENKIKQYKGLNIALESIEYNNDLLREIANIPIPYTSAKQREHIKTFSQKLQEHNQKSTESLKVLEEHLTNIEQKIQQSLHQQQNIQQRLHQQQIVENGQQNLEDSSRQNNQLQIIAQNIGDDLGLSLSNQIVALKALPDNEAKMQSARSKYAKDFISDYNLYITEHIKYICNYNDECDEIVQTVKEDIQNDNNRISNILRSNKYNNSYQSVNIDSYNDWKNIHQQWLDKYCAAKDKYERSYKLTVTENEKFLTSILSLKEIVFDGPQAFDSLIEIYKSHLNTIYSELKPFTKANIKFISEIIQNNNDVLEKLVSTPPVGRSHKPQIHKLKDILQDSNLKLQEQSTKLQDYYTGITKYFDDTLNYTVNWQKKLRPQNNQLQRFVQQDQQQIVENGQQDLQILVSSSRQNNQHGIIEFSDPSSSGDAIQPVILGKRIAEKVSPAKVGFVPYVKRQKLDNYDQGQGQNQGRNGKGL